MLIGLGPHARRIYYPIFEKDGAERRFNIPFAVDLESQRDVVETYLGQRRGPKPEMHYVAERDRRPDELADATSRELNAAVARYGITGVIIATEPLAHMPYARWALRNGLSVLMDKPVSSRAGVSTSSGQARAVLDDFDELAALYAAARKKNPRIVFSLMAQRRYHPAFQKIRSLIREVHEKTNCPVTSIQTFHSDGQWRLPPEIIEQDYHPYNQGYGKCSHSGYHFFDIDAWLMAAAEGPDKKIDSVQLATHFSRPNDFVRQVTFDDHRKLFPDFDRHDRYGETVFRKTASHYGELDAFTSLAFKSGDDVITLGSINLVHNGFSQRNWVSAKGRDLYKGNGRVRHESHQIIQGPFQSILYLSYQGEEVDPAKDQDLWSFGGEYHLEIHVFRNDKLFPEWKNHERYGILDFGGPALGGASRGHQEDARRQSVLEFVACLHATGCEPRRLISDLDDHRRGVALMSGIYRSACRRRDGADPLVTIPY